MAAVKKLLAVLVVMASVAPSYSLGTNGFTNRGKKFILGFAHNMEGEEPPQVIITVNDYPANIRITIPGINFLQHVFVERLQSVQIDLTSSTRFREMGKAQLGVLIESDADIGVIGVNRVINSNDAYLALPVEMLGSEYYAVTWTMSAFIFLVGAENHTTCNFTFPNSPKFDDVGARQTTVDRLETYQLIHEGILDFTGTLILCDKPVVVYSGNQMSKVHGHTVKYRDSFDHLVEQLTPVGQWGKEYTMIHSERKMSSTLRVIAGHPDTTVTFALNNSTVLLRNPGDYYTMDMVGNRSIYLISSDKPIQAVVFDKSAAADVNEIIDPSMTVLIPNSNFLNNITIAPIDDRNLTFQYVTYMLVITDADSVDTMLINNENAPTEGWVPVSGSDSLVTRMIPLERKAYFLENTNKSATFMAYVFGNARFESYAYPAGISALYEQVCEHRPQLKNADEIDNDCDGKVDEEEDNGKDDDGDGRIDEDNKKATIICDEYECHKYAACADSKNCRCVKPYIGEGRFECVNPDTHCGCTTYGDPHVVTFRDDRFELPLRCTYQVLDVTLAECSVKVWVQGRPHTDNPLLSMLDKVTWTYSETNGPSLSGYAYNNEVYFNDGEKVPFNRDYMVGKLLVKFLVDEAGFYTISSTCGVVVRYRDPVVSIRTPKPFIDKKATVTNTLCGECRLNTSSELIRASASFRAIRPSPQTLTQIDGHCSALASVVGSCSEERLDTVMEKCAPLMNSTLPYRACGKKAEDIHKAITACASSVCLSGYTDQVLDDMNDFIRDCR